MVKNKIPRWFMNRLHTVMKHNEYTEEMITVEECNKSNKWTPTDLILREYYNNGGGSSKGFLGLPTYECKKCYQFIKENQEILREMDYYNQEGYNNFGFRLWHNYEVH